MRSHALQRSGRVGLALVLVAFAAALSALAQEGGAPDVVRRSAWGAKPADTALMKPQTPHEIVIHHTSVRQQPKLTLEQKLRGLQSFSQTPGTVNARPKPAWGDMPYHFYIDLGGRIGEGRDVKYAGDTNTKYSTANRIQIVLEGHFDKEQPTPAQLQSLDRFVIWLAAKYRVPAGKISGHNDHVPTDCPGSNLKDHLPALRDMVAKASAGK
jgi:hypothetical protein